MKPTRLMASLVILGFAIFQMANAQDVSWSWMKQIGSSGLDGMYELVTDHEGNVLIATQLSADATIDGTPVSNLGAMQDAYLIKFSPEGEVLWYRQFGSPEVLISLIEGLDVDSEGNVYCGISALTFLGGSIDVDFAGINLSASTQAEAFVVKLDADGNGIWQVGTNDPLLPSLGFRNKLVVGLNDIIYFSRPISFGSVQIGDYNFNSPEGDMAIAALNTEGDVLWAKQIIGEGNEQQISLAAASDGGVLCTGYWYGETLSINEATLLNPDALQNANPDRYIAKFDETGEVTMLVREGGLGDESIVASIAGTPDGGAMVYSFVYDPISIGGQEFLPGTHVLSRYNASGELLFVKAMGSDAAGFPSSIRSFTGEIGNIYLLTYIFNGPSSILDGQEIMNSAGIFGTKDAIVAGINAQGDLLWHILVEGPENEIAFRADMDYSGSLVVGGQFTSASLLLGNTQIDNTSEFTEDLYLAKADFGTIVEEYQEFSRLNPYPVPAHDELMVDLSFFGSKKVIARILDLAGNEVLKTEVRGDALLELDISEFNPGMYILAIQTPDHELRKKFLKD